MFHKKTALLSLLLVLCLCFTSCITIEKQEDEEAEAGLMSSFAATDLYGEEVDQSILSEKTLTMVNVWATYCSPCIQEMPALGELSEEYAEKGVQIIGMVADVFNSDGSINEAQVGTAKEIVESTGASYVHLLPSEDLYGILTQVTAIPTTFFVDENGQQVGYGYVGSKTKSQWVDVIEETLAEVEN